MRSVGGPTFKKNRMQVFWFCLVDEPQNGAPIHGYLVACLHQETGLVNEYFGDPEKRQTKCLISNPFKLNKKGETFFSLFQLIFRHTLQSAYGQAQVLGWVWPDLFDNLVQKFRIHFRRKWSKWSYQQWKYEWKYSGWKALCYQVFFYPIYQKLMKFYE